MFLMDDRTYLLGKLAALESALEAAMSTHPEPALLVAALSKAMSTYTPARCPADVRSFAEGWMAIVTPLLTDQACPRGHPGAARQKALPVASYRKGRMTH